MSYAREAEIVARVALARQWETLAHTLRVVRHVDAIVSDHHRAELNGFFEEVLAVAWLHDVVEDAQVEIDDLRDIGFDELILDAVSLVTRAPGVGYDEYRGRLLNAGGLVGRVARTVKLCDAHDNLARCEAAGDIPKWRRLADDRYRPLIAALEAA